VIQTAGSACDDQAENELCVWQLMVLPSNTRGYRALGCYRGLTGKVWSGVDVPLGGGSIQPPDAECPHQAPALGGSCPNRTDVETCVYPTNYCECGSLLPGQWLCTEALAGMVSPPVPVQRLCAPTSFDETQLVKEMGPKLTALWCAWDQQVGGYADVAVSGKDSPGVADSYAYHTLSSPELSLCLADLPSGYCSQNLDTFGFNCTATIGELDDCMETIRAAKTGGWVGHGCAPLLSNPTCVGVLAQHFADKGKASQCVVPLQ